MPEQVTQLIQSIQNGDPTAADELLPIVYEELRQLARVHMARENPGHTLQPTALVHEAYLRLLGPDESPQWNGRGHFFASAAEAMRRILIEEARRKGRIKHGGNQARIPLEQVREASQLPPDQLIELDEAINEMTELDPEKAEVIKLRFFAGYTIVETAEALGISPATVKRHWTFARAYLFDRLRAD